MRSEKPDILERSIAYSLQIINLHRMLEKDNVGRVLGRQLLRSGTSIGANIHEAQGGQSKADLIAKLSIAYKGAHEAAYWLRLIREAALTPAECLGDAIDETNQLIKILSSILLHTKQGTPN